MVRAPISIGIQPQIALYSVVLGSVCAFAAFTERYRRDQDEIDDRLKERYYANMRDAQAKTPFLTQSLRGQDATLDEKMNRLVWGGKANMESPPSPANGTTPAVSDDDSSEDSESSSAMLKSEDGSSSSDGDATEEGTKTRKKKRKGRKRKRAKKAEEPEPETPSLAEEQQKLMVQSVAAGAAVGAVAVAAAVFLAGPRK